MALSSEQAEMMFGCQVSDLVEMVEDICGDPMMLVMCILSDAQEELARGNAERARQYMNRAKWLQSKLMGALRNRQVFLKRDEVKYG